MLWEILETREDAIVEQWGATQVIEDKLEIGDVALEPRAGFG